MAVVPLTKMRASGMVNMRDTTLTQMTAVRMSQQQPQQLVAQVRRSATTAEVTTGVIVSCMPMVQVYFVLWVQKSERFAQRVQPADW